MDTPSTITNIATLCASAALLTPLVKALNKWHIDIRKTSIPKKTAPTRQSPPSTDAERTKEDRDQKASRSEWSFFVLAMLFTGWNIYRFCSYSYAPSRVEIVILVLNVALFLLIGLAFWLLSALRKFGTSIALARRAAERGEIASDLMMKALSKVDPNSPKP